MHATSARDSSLAARRELRLPQGYTRGFPGSHSVWQPVAVRLRAVFIFTHRHRRFNPQTQFLFASRRSRTPRGALFLPDRHSLAAGSWPRRVLARQCTLHPIGMATVESTRTRRLGTKRSASDAPQLVGRLGPWQLVRPLGEGNFTRVYLARPADGPQNQPAAYVVKVLRKEWWRDPQAIDMQRREAWVGSKVSHPNLLPVLSASVEEPPFYLVTPKLDGATLAQLIVDHGRLGVPLALWIARQVADGLAALFDATGMIHTDVKPANILVSPAGHATLIDFGFVQTPCRGEPMGDAPARRHAGLHRARDGDVGTRGRTAKRYLQPRRDALRNAHRPAAVEHRRPGRARHAPSREPSRPTSASSGPNCPTRSRNLSIRCSPRTRSAGQARPANWRLAWCGWKLKALRCGSKHDRFRLRHDGRFSPR